MTEILTSACSSWETRSAYEGAGAASGARSILRVINIPPVTRPHPDLPFWVSFSPPLLPGEGERHQGQCHV